MANYRKKQSIEDIEYSIRTFQSAGIRVHGMFVLGSDEDDIETARQTVAFARRHDLDSMQFNVLTPLPGSRDYDRMRKRGGVLA